MIFLKSPQRSVLLLGSNQGDRFMQLEQAAGFIEQKGISIEKLSSVYQTAAWGVENQQSFLNQALLVNTTLSPSALMSRMLAVEKKMGRVRSGRWLERKIDIDIILFEHQIVKNPLITIPHPLFQKRRFALIALNEIVPDWIHPQEQKTVAELLEECTDPLMVEKYMPALHAL